MKTVETVRALSPTERAAFAAARVRALGWQPYLATALFGLTPLAAPGLDTMGVDALWRVYIDPAVFDRWGPEASGAVLLHEVNHLVRDHAARADAHGVASKAEHDAWNLAGDAESNDDLLAATVPLPEGCITPGVLGQADGLTVEVYYDGMSRPPESPGSPESGDEDGEGCGSGAGGRAGSWELGAGDPLAPGMSAAEADLVRRKVAADVAAAARSATGRGTVPGGLARWADDVLRAPVVPWRRVLAGALRRALRDRAGRVDYSYARPSRRQVPRVILPAMRQPVPSVGVVVDTSGSMTADDLHAALSEVKGICARVGVRGDQLRVLAVDASAAEPQPVRRVEAIRLTGGGGTDMRVGIAAAEALRPPVDSVVVLTDGGTPWPDAPGRVRLVVGLIGSPECIASAKATWPPPSWATVVEIPTT